ncbi:MAG: pyridoxamine 5'-phosphate oxidase family protein [Sedimentisphaerales bacterium]|nr:pyridoxamine 5'-phosphate oxidase family protein [Sedimentisphaerales bacterium]
MTDKPELERYFEETHGIGVLSTADGQGQVNSAIYARPHLQDDGTVAFIMRERRTYANLAANPQACYLFIEDGPGYTGKRLYMTKIREDSDSTLIEKMRRREKPHAGDEEAKSVVYFRVDQVRPLVGG